MKKLAGWALAVFVVWFAAKNPAGATHVAKALGSGLAAVGTGLGDMLTRLAA